MCRRWTGLPNMASQPPLGGPDHPPPANRWGPPSVSQAEVQAPLSPMCPRLNPKLSPSSKYQSNLVDPPYTIKKKKRNGYVIWSLFLSLSLSGFPFHFMMAI